MGDAGIAVEEEASQEQKMAPGEPVPGNRWKSRKAGGRFKKLSPMKSTTALCS